MLNIEIWSDYTCPYCYIGKKQLFQVLEDMNITEYKIKHRVYLLNPGKETHPERTFLEGLNLSEAEKKSVFTKFTQIKNMASAVGLNYDMEHIPDISTEDAHRLTLWAQERNMHTALNNRIFKAYFEECQDISSHTVLAKLAQEVGLPEQEALDLLADHDAYREQLFIDYNEAGEHEVDLIPHYTFEDKIDIMGIMTLDSIRKHIEMAL